MLDWHGRVLVRGIGEVLDDWSRVPPLNCKMKWQFENFASASGRDMTAFIGVSPQKKIEGASKFHWHILNSSVLPALSWLLGWHVIAGQSSDILSCLLAGFSFGLATWAGLSLGGALGRGIGEILDIWSWVHPLNCNMGRGNLKILRAPPAGT